MKIFNVTLSILLCIAAAVALVFVVKFDEAKVRLIENPETKAERLVKLALAYDTLLNVDSTRAPSSVIRRDQLALDENKSMGITRIRKTLARFNDQYQIVKEYREQLVRTLISTAEALELPIAKGPEKQKAMEESLNNANNVEQTLLAMRDEVQKLQNRDKMLYDQLLEVMDKLNKQSRIPFDTSIISKMKNLYGEQAELFTAINVQITAIEKRKELLATYLSDIAVAAGVEAPNLSGDIAEVTMSIDNMFTQINTLLSQTRDLQSELRSEDAKVAKWEDKEARRKADLETLDNWIKYKEEYLHLMAKEIWNDPDPKELIDYQPIQFTEYYKKYEYVKGNITKVEHQWKTAQIDIGRAYIAEEPLKTQKGELGHRVNKVRAPIYPGFIMKIYRPGVDKSIGDLLITQVSECSAIGNIQNFTTPIQVGDYVKYDIEVRKQLNIALGGTTTAPKTTSEETSEGGDTATDDPIDEGGWGDL